MYYCPCCGRCFDCGGYVDNIEGNDAEAKLCRRCEWEKEG